MATENETAAEVVVPTINDRDAILSEMDALTDEGDAAEAPETEESQEETEDGTTEDAEETTEESEDVDIDAKKLETLQRRDKKQQEERSAFEEERTAFASKKAELNDRISRLDELERRAKYDPAWAMEQLGLEPDSFEDAARDIYNKRPNAKPNAGSRQALQQKQRDDALNTVTTELRELKESMAQEKVQARQEIEHKAYLSEISGSTTEDTPIVAKLLKANPSKFQNMADEVAHRLWKESGEVPDSIDVVKEMENTKRNELLELGFELPGSPPKSPNQSQQIQASKTLTSDLSSSTKSRTEPLSQSELRSDVLRGMPE